MCTRVSSYVAMVIAAAFTASAVLGLCAMIADSGMSSAQMPCAGSSFSMLACEGNIVRHTITIGIAMVSLVLFLLVGSGPSFDILQVAGPPDSEQYHRPAWLPALILQEAFSRGILQPKLFA